jgi:hypothetical protein
MGQAVGSHEDRLTSKVSVAGTQLEAIGSLGQLHLVVRRGQALPVDVVGTVADGHEKIAVAERDGTSGHGEGVDGEALVPHVATLGHLGDVGPDWRSAARASTIWS